MKNFLDRYVKTTQETEYGKPVEVKKPNWLSIIRDSVISVFSLIILSSLISNFWPFSSVPTGSRGVITQMGKITSIHDEGMVVLLPWEKLNIFNIRAEKVNIDKAEGSTKDTQQVWVSLTVRYSVKPTCVAEVYEKYSHDGKLDDYISTASQEVFKAVTAQYSAPQLVAERPKVSQGIYSAIEQRISKYCAQVIAIDMRNFSFSDSYMAAINKKATEDQLRQAADNELLTVESKQKQTVAIAQAAADAQKAKADGEAYSLLTVATAQANSLKVQNAALAQNKDVLELRRIEVQMEQAKQWDGKLPQNMYSGAPVPFLNLIK